MSVWSVSRSTGDRAVRRLLIGMAALALAALAVIAFLEALPREAHAARGEFGLPTEKVRMLLAGMRFLPLADIRAGAAEISEKARVREEKGNHQAVQRPVWVEGSVDVEQEKGHSFPFGRQANCTAGGSKRETCLLREPCALPRNLGGYRKISTRSCA